MRDNKNSKMTIIKGITISFFFAGSTVVLAKDDCADLTGCANHQLLTAKRQGNSHQVAGLNKALNNINAYCTHDGLKAELQQKIDDTNSEIEEYKTDLKKAKHDKVEKYQQKLNDKTKQLKQLINELNSLID
ncbi:DUF1090 domain-containing protein [Pseudoalteromonas tetraodonis]|uniref:DUF1090 domain-containing protein n=1 Tax=Pseudoalteromonas tetraodonis TaxID=43659 RepID=UPI003CFE6D0F